MPNPSVFYNPYNTVEELGFKVCIPEDEFGNLSKGQSRISPRGNEIWPGLSSKGYTLTGGIGRGMEWGLSEAREGFE